MYIKKPIKLLLFLILLTVNLFAIDGKIRVFIKTNDAIYTSQKVTVSVELLSDAFSITDAKITFPSSKKFIVQAPQSAAYLGKEEIDDIDWQMVHYDYEVYALQAGKIEIPSVFVSFTASMGYGQPKKEFTLKSDTLHFDVKAPKGVKNNQFVLVSDNYTVVSKRKPEKKQLIIGDAVELSITQKANNIPDILLRPIVYQSNAFVRVYDKEPELKSGLKGDYDVSRTDRFTFVASGEGNVTIPLQEILWWNSTTQKIQIATIPDISFEIIPDPQIAIDAKKVQQKQRLLYLIMTLLLLFILYKIFGSKVRDYMNERKRVYALSESGKYSVLLASIKDNDVPGIYKPIYSWLLTIAPELTRGGFSTIIEEQPSFETSLYELEEKMLYQKQTFDEIRFTNELKKLRESLLKQQEVSHSSLPENINPL